MQKCTGNIEKGKNSIHTVAGMPYRSRLARFLMRMQIVCTLQRNRAYLGQKSVNKSQFCIRMMLIKHKFSRVYRESAL